MVNESKIFTHTEMVVIDNRMKGIKSDPTGIFSGRIKPKIKEILDVWFKKKDELESLLK